MPFMIIDTREIIMTNQMCEIIDFINGGKINKPLYCIYTVYNKEKVTLTSTNRQI